MTVPDLNAIHCESTWIRNNSLYGRIGCCRRTVVSDIPKLDNTLLRSNIDRSMLNARICANIVQVVFEVDILQVKGTLTPVYCTVQSKEDCTCLYWCDIVANHRRSDSQVPIITHMNGTCSKADTILTLPLAML